jgi:hypothetical protein
LYLRPPDKLGQALTNLRIVRGGGHPWSTAEVEQQLKATGFERIETSLSPSVMFVLGQRPASKSVDIERPR